MMSTSGDESDAGAAAAAAAAAAAMVTGTVQDCRRHYLPLQFETLSCCLATTTPTLLIHH